MHEVIESTMTLLIVAKKHMDAESIIWTRHLYKFEMGFDCFHVCHRKCGCPCLFVHEYWWSILMKDFCGYDVNLC